MRETSDQVVGLARCGQCGKVWVIRAKRGKLVEGPGTGPRALRCMQAKRTRAAPLGQIQTID
jgi:hypothetical protein